MTTVTKTLHIATIERLGPDDDQGPYFWLSPDGERWLEVAELPSSPVEASAWYDDVVSEMARSKGPFRIKVHRRLLAHGGAEFSEAVLG